jgi:hypothetical protein
MLRTRPTDIPTAVMHQMSSAAIAPRSVLVNGPLARYSRITANVATGVVTVASEARVAATTSGCPRR